MAKVIVYSTPTCVFCKMAKAYFTEHNVQFEEKNVMTDIPAQEEMIKKSGQLGVPVIDIDGKIIIGFDKSKIASLLNIK
ncbi:MAG: glutaredoxin family protein [Patescibacteria group bacterium]